LIFSKSDLLTRVVVRVVDVRDWVSEKGSEVYIITGEELVVNVPRCLA
jgi:hypothetical protein